MKPLQVWLPQLKSAATAGARRDRDRALGAWAGELSMWLLPDAKRVFRWKDEDFFRRFAGVPAEDLDMVDVYHIGDRGVVYGRARGRFVNGRIDDLLDQWLNCKPLLFDSAPTQIVFNYVPVLKGHRITFSSRKIKVRPFNALPIVDVGDDGTFSAIWPPPGRMVKTVSPDAESAEEQGPLDPLIEKGTTLGVGRRTGTRTLWGVVGWPEIIQNLVAGGDGADLLLAREQMRSIAKKSVDDIQGAVTEAARMAAGHVFVGHTYRALSWFCTLYEEGGNDAVVFKAEDLGFRGKDANDLWRTPKFRSFMSERIPIRRAWGAVGLFWALLLDRLEEGRSFRICACCSRIISGRSDKTFCSRPDNPECFAQRRATDKRRSRTDRARKRSIPSKPRGKAPSR